MAITDPPYERYPSVALPAVLPLPAPPQGPDGLVSYIQTLHRVLSDQQVKLSTAMQILAYHRTLFGDEDERPSAVGSGSLFVEMDTQLAYYDNPRLSTPAWGLVKAASEGYLVELDTKSFDGILSVTDDDVQTAMDTIDDHTHSSFTDLNITGTLYVDTIEDYSPTHGVTIESVGHLSGVVQATGLQASSYVKANTIIEYTFGSGVSVDGVFCKDYDVFATDLSASGSVITDTIAEYTSATGVTIDSVLLKDNTVLCATLAATTHVGTDAIVEVTPGNGVDIDGVTLKDDSVYASYADITGTITVDTINEHTSGNGVYIDGARIKDQGASFYAQVNVDTLNVNGTAPYVDLQSSGVGNYWRIYTPNTANGSFIISDLGSAADCFIVEDAVGANALVVGATYLSTTKAFQVDHIYEKTAAHGVDIDGVLLKDSAITANASSGIHATLGDGTYLSQLNMDCSGSYSNSIVFKAGGTAKWKLQHTSADTIRFYDTTNSKERFSIAQDGDMDLMLPATSGYVNICNQWGGTVSKFAATWCNLQINGSAPADADMGTKTFTLYNSGTTIYLKHKDYAGTCRTGTVCTVA